jgi:hypothetical protein
VKKSLAIVALLCLPAAALSAMDAYPRTSLIEVCGATW